MPYMMPTAEENVHYEVHSIQVYHSLLMVDHSSPIKFRYWNVLQNNIKKICYRFTNNAHIIKLYKHDTNIISVKRYPLNYYDVRYTRISHI